MDSSYVFNFNMHLQRAVIMVYEQAMVRAGVQVIEKKGELAMEKKGEYMLFTACLLETCL